MKGTGAYFEVGDISRAGGLDTPAHATHEDGKAFDMRPMRNDGGMGQPFALDPNTFEHRLYHRIYTADFIRMVKQLYPSIVIYSNDEKIFKLPEFNSYVFSDPGHFDHLHIILPGGQRDKDEGKLRK